MRTVTGAALAGACVAASLVVPAESARAEGRAGHFTDPSVASPPPGMSLPGFHAPAVSNGTVSSGSVRVQPARMPFYVATKGKVTLYVLGTLHTGDPSDYPSVQPFRPRILAALAASPTLALEAPDDLLESQDDVSKYGVCRYRACSACCPSRWQRSRRLRGNPAALVEIRKMRPWLAALVVETYDSLSAGLQTEYGTEAQLQNVFLKKRAAA